MDTRRIGWLPGIGIYLRGLAMGAADLVPGVSGGTVAFITGIYERLLSAIGNASSEGLQLLLGRRWRQAWQAVDGTFLLILFAGIFTSIFLFARVVGYLLEQHPVVIWAFFCGLILASSFHLMREVRRWGWVTIGAFAVGALAALIIALVKPVEVVPTLPIVFVAGAVAICAMILPGISGSFLLVLMGLYAPILSAVKDMDVALLLTFAAGCGLGLLSFARLLSWLLKRFYDRAMALLTGFLFGSLFMVWPWKIVLEWYVGSGGEQMPLSQRNVLPGSYAAVTGQDPHTAMAIIAAVVGYLLVWALEQHGSRLKASSEAAA